MVPGRTMGVYFRGLEIGDSRFPFAASGITA